MSSPKVEGWHLWAAIHTMQSALLAPVEYKNMRQQEIYYVSRTYRLRSINQSITKALVAELLQG